MLFLCSGVDGRIFEHNWKMLIKKVSKKKSKLHFTPLCFSQSRDFTRNRLSNFHFSYLSKIFCFKNFFLPIDRKSITNKRMWIHSRICSHESLSTIFFYFTSVRHVKNVTFTLNVHTQRIINRDNSLEQFLKIFNYQQWLFSIVIFIISCVEIDWTVNAYVR